MSETGAIVLTVVVAVLLFVGVPAWYIWAKRTWVWPKGKRKVKGRWLGFDVTLLVSDAAAKELGDLDLLAKRCARAAYTLATVYRKNPLNPKHDILPRLFSTAVMFLTDEEFDGTDPKMAEVRSGWAATLGKITKRVSGDYLAMPIIRTIYESRVLNSGEPFIHEMLHAIVWDTPDDGIPYYDYEHADPRVWVAADAEASLQAKARADFKAAITP